LAIPKATGGGPTKLTRARVGIAKASSWVLDFAIPKVEDGRV